MDSPGCLSDSGTDWDLTFAGIDAMVPMFIALLHGTEATQQ